MATIYLRLSKKCNDLNKKEVILTFRHGRYIFQRAGTRIFIVDKPAYWDGEKMVLKARSMTPEAKYHREQKDRLDEICKVVNQRWMEADMDNVSPTWLKNVIAEFYQPAKGLGDDPSMDVHRDTVTSTFPQFVASRRVSMYREKHFWTMWRMLRRYELLQGTVFEFETFSHKDLEGFRAFLIKEHEYWVRDKETKKMKCSNRRYLKAFDQVNEECQKFGRKIESRCPEPRSKNTLNNILLILKSYWLWCMKEGYADRNPSTSSRLTTLNMAPPSIFPKRNVSSWRQLLLKEWLPCSVTFLCFRVTLVAVWVISTSSPMTTSWMAASNTLRARPKTTTRFLSRYRSCPRHRNSLRSTMTRNEAPCSRSSASRSTTFTSRKLLRKLA